MFFFGFLKYMFIGMNLVIVLNIWIDLFVFLVWIVSFFLSIVWLYVVCLVVLWFCFVFFFNNIIDVRDVVSFWFSNEMYCL